MLQAGICSPYLRWSQRTHAGIKSCSRKKKLKSCLQEENLLMPAGLCRRTPELKASHWPVTWRWHWSIRLKSQSPFKLDWILWGL